LEKVDLKVTILHELPNEGRTIIEKFVDSSDVGFAVILLTGDDRGGVKTASFEDQKLRARQNVIFELGYFTANLGRGQVCAIYEDEVEIPSDYQGVVFIRYDEAGGWKLRLANELQAAGIPVDKNKID
jgi:predicted nucleotide-binding protein